MNATRTEEKMAAPAPAPATAPAPAPAPAPAGETNYEACDQCSAPVDSNQRYCVVCGTRRKHVYDPSASFLSSATSLARSKRSPARGAGGRKRRSFSLGTAAVLVAIPLAVAAGVLVERGANGTDSKLLAALKAQQPTVVNVGAAAGASGASTQASSTPVVAPTPTLVSTFALASGFAVELQAIPSHGATQASVAATKQKLKAKGAGALGLITASGSRITPSPPAGDDVIYSGQYKTKSAADAALAKLKHSFPAAKVISVRTASAATGAAGGGKVLAKTANGTADQATGYKPSASQLAAGAQAASKTAKETNGNYVKSQQGLPDQVSVP
jgi:hypothetical protein